MQRHSLSNCQKLAIRNEANKRKREGKSCSQTELAHWAKDNLSIPFLPSQPVMSRILNNEIAIPITARNIKRQRSGAQPHLEAALAIWVRSKYDSRILINGSTIRSKASDFQDSINSHLPQESQITLKFTTGWLTKFMKRWNLRSCRSYADESSDSTTTADENGNSITTADELKALQRIVGQYELADVWNADETGLQYSMAPDRSMSEHLIHGRRGKQPLLTLLMSGNADGSEKLPLMFIGVAKKPRAFGSKSGQDLGFDYWHNRRARMDSVLFFEWLNRFNNYICQKPGRNVLLLLDNCSAHGTKRTIPTLSNVRIQYLPPNTTSQYQPMTAGITRSFKIRYRRLQYERALDFGNDNEHNIYRLDQLTAMKYCRSVWNETEPNLHVYCWNKTKLLDTHSSQVTNVVDSCDASREALHELVNKIVPGGRRMPVADLLKADPDDIIEKPGFETLVDNVVQEVRESDGLSLNPEVGDSVILLPRTDEQLRCLSIALRIVEAQEEPSVDVLRYIRRLKRQIADARAKISSQR